MRNDVPGPALDALVLRLARATAAGMDVLAVLTDVCHTLSISLSVRGTLAVALKRGASGRDELGPVAGSDEQFARLGRIQRETAGGPLATTLRFGRPLLTTDLLRAGPPELAASVAELGVSGSLTIPLVAAGELVGAVQLLGDHTAPVGLGQLEPVAAMLEVLAARLHDARLLEAHAFDARPPVAHPDDLRAPDTRPVGRAPDDEPRDVNRAAEGWPPEPTPAETQVLSARGPDAERPDADPSDSATIAIPLPSVDSDTTELRLDRTPAHGRPPAPRQRAAEPDRQGDDHGRADRSGGDWPGGDRSGGDHPPLSGSPGGRHAAPRPSPRPRTPDRPSEWAADGPAEPQVPTPRHQEPVESPDPGAVVDADEDKTGTIPTAPPPRDPEPPARHPRTAL
jgi:hypothetical protein